MLKIRHNRNENGTLAGLIVASAVVINVCLCAIGVDTSHYLATKDELQNACDAGALAGAMDLMNNIGSAESDARTVAAKNFADATEVDDRVERVKVEVTVTPPEDGKGGFVHVHGQVTVRNIFAHMIGRHFDTIVTDSVAGTTGKLIRANSGQVFPIAVSLDAGSADEDGTKQQPLYTKRPGDFFKLYFNTSEKNAAFTSFTDVEKSTPWLTDAMREAAGVPTKKDRHVPGVGVGDEIFFNNGSGPYHELARDPLYGAIANRVLIFPVVLGEAPFNHGRKVVSFVAMRPTTVQKSSNGEPKSLGGILVNAQPRGISGKLDIDGPTYLGDAIERLSPGPVQLIR